MLVRGMRQASHSGITSYFKFQALRKANKKTVTCVVKEDMGWLDNYERIGDPVALCVAICLMGNTIVYIDI